MRCAQGRSTSTATAVSGALSDSLQNKDDAFQKAFKAIFPDADLLPLSLGEWRDNAAKLCEEAVSTRTLVLFDLNFERETTAARYGVQLIQDTKDNPNLILGILSHAMSPEEEPRVWEEISEQANVPTDRFVVLSKQRLSSDGSKELIEEGLRRVVLAKDIKQVKAALGEIVKTCVQKAEEDLGKVSIYDFDQAIFRSSQIEGVWEGDTYFRLFNAAIRRHAQSAMRGEDELNRNIVAIREKFPIDPKIDPTVIRNAWKLHHREVYEDQEFINGHGLPIANGDIFAVAGQNAGSAKHYVLVCQPCDLVVRSDGKRSRDKGLAAVGFWLEVLRPLATRPVTSSENVSADVDAPAAEERPQRCRDFELPYYWDEGATPGRLDLFATHYIWLAALDLCVLNRDGVARLNLDATNQRHVHLLPGWQKRVGMLQKEFKKPLDVLSNVKLSEADRKVLINALLPCPSRSLKLAVSLIGEENNQTLAIGIKRVGRLAPQRAAALLGRLAAQLSRPAFEHDLTREK